MRGSPDKKKPSPLHTPAIDKAWQAAVVALGLRLVRTGDAYASTDGQGTLLIGQGSVLDEDDSLAQLVLHEICHALVQGDHNWSRPDWGLDNTTTADDVRERACLRLQAHLADSIGLRAMFVPTTEWNTYYNALPSQPLQLSTDAEISDHTEQDACALALAALERLGRPHMAGPVYQALAVTAGLLVDLHPTGFPWGPTEQTCGTCAWQYSGGRGTAVTRCRQTGNADKTDQRVSAALRACSHWESPVDCLTCGACCREAYHVVSVAVRDPVVWKHPELIVRNGHRFSVLRQADHCAALTVIPDDSGSRRFACQIYEDRPQTCRDFAQGGQHCLVARRRVGMSQ